VIAGAVLAVPTLLRLGQQIWGREFGEHGPIVLFTASWLIWRKWPALKAEARPGIVVLAIAGIVASLVVYVLGRAFDLLVLEAGGLYGFGIAYMYGRFGGRALMRNWFPFAYLGLMLPMPSWLLDEVTSPLKLFVSYLATSIVSVFGMPVVREGVTMTVGPYQLLVEDACSGMNSLIGLVSVTTFYIYLVRDASWRYSAFLVSLIIPIAILANVIRIIAVILLTYFFGDAVGQGVLHMTAGLFLFAISLGIMFVIDNATSRFLSSRTRSA
jgi:exosortase